VLLLSFLGAAFFLDYFKTKGLVLLGFAILMFLAGSFRFICSLYFKKHYYPKLVVEEKDDVGFKHFIKHISKFNFGRFSLFTTLMWFSISICGAFFSVYMLKDLNFSYTTFMLVSIAGSIFHLIALPVWGKVSDKYGNKTLISIGTFLIAIMPFMWLFSVNPFYLIFVPQLIIGLGWSAFGLGSTNFVYDVVPKHKRGFYISYQHILMSLGIFVGSFIGGILAQYLPKMGSSNLPLLFIISGTLRVIVIALFLPRVKEVRKVKPMHFNDLRLMTARTYVYGHHHHLIIFKKLKDFEKTLVKVPHNLFVKFFRSSKTTSNKFLNQRR
jgi:MFS family permease